MSIGTRLLPVAAVLALVAGLGYAVQQASSDDYLVELELSWVVADVDVDARFTVGSHSEAFHNQTSGKVYRVWPAKAGDLATITAQASKLTHAMTAKITQKRGIGATGAPKRKTGWGNVYLEKDIH